MTLMNPEGTEKWKSFVAACEAGGVSRPADRPTKVSRRLKSAKKNTEKSVSNSSEESGGDLTPEERLTIACYSEFIKKYPEYHKRLWHTPNENFVAEIGGKRKAMGVLSGVADFKLDIPATIDGVFICGLDIELKVGRNPQIDTQKEFEDYSLATGHIYRVIRSVESFMELVDNYLACVDPAIHEAIKRLNMVWEARWKEIEAKKNRRSQESEKKALARCLGIDENRLHFQ